MSGISKSIKINCSYQGKEGREVTANGHGLSFLGDDNVLKLDDDDDDSTTEYTKTTYLYTSEWMNAMACALYV